MREKVDYRDNYEALLEYFGRDHNLLTIKDVAKFCGRNERTVVSLYNLSRNGITIASLARKMCAT